MSPRSDPNVPRGARPLLPSPLYAIVDADAAAPRSCVAMAAGVLAGGGRVLQLRMKNRPSGEILATARAIRALLPQSAFLLIVNDRADIALAAEADGVHLGAEDLPVAAARRLLPPGMLVGRSTHGLEEALAAEAAGADYVAFGPIFPTASKSLSFPPQGLERLRELCRRVRVPVVAIGGITTAAATGVAGTGAAAVAVIGELARAGDLPAATRCLLASLETGAPR